MTNDNASTGELVSRLSQDVSVLIRDELRLAQAEVSEKAKQTGIGFGWLGTAGIIALYGVGVLIATAIIALALVLDAWLAALVVGITLLAVAGGAGLVGKKRVTEAVPPLPTDAVESIKQDVAAAKGGAHR